MSDEASRSQAADRTGDLSRVVFFLGGVRSGTTVFRRMLASHPRMRDRGEIFNSHNTMGYFKYVRERVAEQPDLIFPENNAKLFMSYLPTLIPKDPNAIALVDIKYEHLTLVPDAWQLPFTNPPMLRLLKRTKCKVIHLRRQHFYSVMSNLVAVQTGNYHQSATAKKDPNAEMPAITADRAAILAAMKKRKRAADVVDSSFDDQHRLPLDYESVFDDDGSFKTEVCERVASFLGIDNQFDRQPALRKVIDRPLSAVIGNYDEIADLESSAL
jgi:hypothetical protein